MLVNPFCQYPSDLSSSQFYSQSNSFETSLHELPFLPITGIFREGSQTLAHCECISNPWIYSKLN